MNRGLSFSDGPSILEQPAVILTSTFQLQGDLHVLGGVQTFINDNTKGNLNIYKAQVTGLEATNPAARMSQPEIAVNKRSIHILLFTMPLPEGAIFLLRRVEHLIVYTERFAMEAKFHMSPDAHIHDFIDAFTGTFIPASEVKIYPLFGARTGLVTSAPLGMLNKSYFRMLHPKHS